MKEIPLTSSRVAYYYHKLMSFMHPQRPTKSPLPHEHNKTCNYR